MNAINALMAMLQIISTDDPNYNQLCGGETVGGETVGGETVGGETVGGDDGSDESCEYNGTTYDMDDLITIRDNYFVKGDSTGMSQDDIDMCDFCDSGWT